MGCAEPPVVTLVGGNCLVDSEAEHFTDLLWCEHDAAGGVETPGLPFWFSRPSRTSNGD